MRVASLTRILIVAALLLAPSSAPARANADKTAETKAATAASNEKSPPAAAPQDEKTGKAREFRRSGICQHLDDLAARYQLPPLFFARLIWQESHFNPNAVSPAGAEGIAQFMPGTAAIWGLEDPFEPGEALLKSAQYLAHLHAKLGNLGLAAAGYNAGSQRVVDWQAGNATMPQETRNYVYAITGASVEDWAEGRAKFIEPQIDRALPAPACEQLSVALKRERAGLLDVTLPDGKRGERPAPPPPWGVQIAGSFSRAIAMREFNEVKAKFGALIGDKRIVMKSSRQEGRGRRALHRVRIGAASRAEADTLCNRLRAAGGACLVMRN